MNIAQGAENAGKVLGIGDDGNVSAVAKSGGITNIPIGIEGISLDCLSISIVTSFRTDESHTYSDTFECVECETEKTVNVVTTIPKVTLGYDIVNKEFVECSEDTATSTLRVYQRNLVNESLTGSVRIRNTNTSFKTAIESPIKSFFIGKRITSEIDKINVNGTITLGVAIVPSDLYPTMRYTNSAGQISIDLIIDNGIITNVIFNYSTGTNIAIFGGISRSSVGIKEIRFWSSLTSTNLTGTIDNVTTIIE